MNDSTGVRSSDSAVNSTGAATIGRPRFLQQRGINVYQIFHHVPAWSRADKDVQAVTDDLRDVYAFARALATQFRGRVQAWEAWNEPDIKLFFTHPSSESAALQKAAYLGFHAVDPQLRVLGPSMAYGTFSENLLENGTGQYLDIWNYHIYADPSAYAARRRGFQNQLTRHGIRVPDWITEAGDPLEGPEGVLGRAARIHQARFLSRAFPQRWPPVSSGISGLCSPIVGRATVPGGSSSHNSAPRILPWPRSPRSRMRWDVAISWGAFP